MPDKSVQSESNIGAEIILWNDESGSGPGESIDCQESEDRPGGRGSHTICTPAEEWQQYAQLHRH